MAKILKLDEYRKKIEERRKKENEAYFALLEKERVEIEGRKYDPSRFLKKRFKETGWWKDWGVK